MREYDPWKNELLYCDNELKDILKKRLDIMEKIADLEKKEHRGILQSLKIEEDNFIQKIKDNLYKEEINDIYQKVLYNSRKILGEKLFDYNLVLIGFMGAGKSTVSSYLKNAFSMEVIEMDQVIEKQQKMKIPQIFETYGEEYFRDLETKLLIDMQERKNVIISCGGGVAMRERNVKEMKKNGKVILLKASPETILERVKDSDERPLLNGNKNVEYIASLMEKRKEKYEAASDIMINTDGKDVSEICEEMIQKLLKNEA